MPPVGPTILCVMLLCTLTFQVSAFLSHHTIPAAVCSARFERWVRHPLIAMRGYHRIGGNNGNDQYDELLTIPIFPLRKNVRLPTELLTLNLYEARYLAMAEYILQNTNGLQTPCFGALYASQKALVVKGGVGPIVPMVEPGDMGVLFILEGSERDVIPTVGSTTRQRIRLVGRGILRFEIRKILHNGFGGESEGLLKDSEPLPFILAQVRIVVDTPDDVHDAVIDELERRIPQESTYFEQLALTGANIFSDKTSVNDIGLELKSFHMSSTMVPDSDAVTRLTLLNMNSTRERFQRLSGSLTIQ